MAFSEMGWQKSFRNTHKKKTEIFIPNEQRYNYQAWITRISGEAYSIK